MYIYNIYVFYVQIYNFVIFQQNLTQAIADRFEAFIVYLENRRIAGKNLPNMLSSLPLKCSFSFCCSSSINLMRSLELKIQRNTESLSFGLK